MVRPTKGSLERSRAAYDSLEGGDTVARLRTHCIRSSKTAWDSLEGGGDVVYQMRLLSRYVLALRIWDQNHAATVFFQDIYGI
jgi:hypothetical protein